MTSIEKKAKLIYELLNGENTPKWESLSEETKEIWLMKAASPNIYYYYDEEDGPQEGF